MSYPLYPHPNGDDLKDPCLVHDGRGWHIFGTAEGIHHSTAPALTGPWTQHEDILLPIVGSGIAAPGVIHDAGQFHLFVQTEFEREGGVCHYFRSADGFDWHHVNTPLASIPGTAEAGIYDTHPSIIGGRRALAYAAFPRVDGRPSPEIYVATADSWAGPWTRMGRILSHDDVAEHHNARHAQNYEWGIEGPQLVELPSGKILLNATCFLPEGSSGRRQRVFFATADAMAGPYRSLGPYLHPCPHDGENGHSSLVLHERSATLCYQARPVEGRWRYGLTTVDLPRAPAGDPAF